jgi:spore coat polysaccharide biosynthesis protein SpsF (cytidylyltransferase family)
MEQNIKIIIVTQARYGSTRLPGKVLLKIKDRELLDIHLYRLNKIKSVDRIIVATSDNVKDDAIRDFCINKQYNYYRGSESNVLDRFYQAVKPHFPTHVVRVTSDCPLLDPEVVEAVIKCALVNDVDYCSNTLLDQFPDGQDCEVIKFSALENAWKNALLDSEKEHVTPYIRKNCNFNGGDKFSSLNFPCVADYNHVRMTVDEPADYKLMKTLIGKLGIDLNWRTYTRYILENKLNIINKDIIRNEGYLKSLNNE